MDKPWLSAYPPGVPATLDLDPTESVVDVVDRAIARFADRPAFSNLGRTISYRELDVLHRRFATWLQSLPGVGPGRPGGDHAAQPDPVPRRAVRRLAGRHGRGQRQSDVHAARARAPAERQRRQGARRAGASAPGCSRRSRTGSGSATCWSRASATCWGFPAAPLVNFAMRYVRRMPAPHVPGAVGWSAVEACDPGDFRQPAPPTGADLACLQYTGGTTGRSRGAMLTHANLVANIRQINTWFAGRSASTARRSWSRRCRCTTCTR